jgi:hypothetical protein
LKLKRADLEDLTEVRPVALENGVSRVVVEELMDKENENSC